jgi:hypothetical protein
MLDLAQGFRAQIIKETAPKLAAKKPFTMQRLRRAAFWGTSAAGALLLAVLTSRGEIDTTRLADSLHIAFASPVARAPMPEPKFDAEAAMQRLSETVRSLAIDGSQIKARLAAVEHDLDDVTGSVSKQIEAADAARRVDDGPTVVGTATLAATLLASAPPPDTVPVPPATVETPVDRPAVDQPAVEKPVPAPPQIAYGVDIGSGLTIQALRARWAAIRSAHPQFFEGLEPIITVRDIPKANRIELRLVVGPLPQANAAAEMCALLTPFGLFCQPTMYDGQHLALR